MTNRSDSRQSSRRSKSSRVSNNNDDDMDIEIMKDRIDVTKQKSLQSSRNTRRRLEESERMAALNMSNISNQNDKLSNIEHNMDIAQLHTDKALTKTERLEQLNKNFITSSVNPLKYYHNSKHNRADSKHASKEKEYNERGASNHSRSTLNEEREMIYNESDRRSQGGRRGRKQLLEGEEDCEVEKEIDENIEYMSSSLSRLKAMALATNQEIDRKSVV